MANSCLICDELIDENDVSVVHEKGIKGLLNASVTRKDGKSSLFRWISSGVVHTSCRKRYTRPESVAADVRSLGETESGLGEAEAGPSGICRRSYIPRFDFKEKCLFCCGSIDEEFHQKQLKRENGRQRTKCAVWR